MVVHNEKIFQVPDIVEKLMGVSRDYKPSHLDLLSALTPNSFIGEDKAKKIATYIFYRDIRSGKFHESGKDADSYVSVRSKELRHIASYFLPSWIKVYIAKHRLSLKSITLA